MGDSAWVDVAAGLLGPLRGSAMAIFGVCAVAAMVLHKCGHGRRLPAALCLISCIVLSALTAVPCTQHGPSTDCTSSSALQDREWRLSGCLLWALITFSSAWRQLRMLKHWEKWSLGMFYAPTPSFEPTEVSTPERMRLPLQNIPDGNEYFNNQ